MEVCFCILKIIFFSSFFPAMMEILFCILKITSFICSSMEVCHEFHNHQLFFSFAFSFPPNEVCSSGLSYLSGGLIDCAHQMPT
jgi:hypothetical protein